MKNPNRRDFLMTAAAAARATASAQGAQKEIRVGVVGTGARGTEMVKRSLHVPGVKITAICDIDEGHATQAQTLVEKATGIRPKPYTRGMEDYKRMIDDADVDVILIMSYQPMHADQAIYAMKAGKHVGSETPSAYTIDKCWELVETKEKTGRRYMLLENYPYARTRMMILNMAHGGVMGDITYGESSYIHDTRELAYQKGGSMSWRGEVAHKYRGDTYPTHALGPVSLWMGINRGDRLATMVSMDTGSKSLQTYAFDHFGKSHPAAQPGFFARHDTTITMLRSANEKLIVLRYDPGSNRPAGGWEGLQGTRGSYDGSPGSELLYLQGRSAEHKWDAVEKYRTEFEHPYWKKDGPLAMSAGHGGGDFFVLREFYRAIAEDREPPIDVYDGCTWSAILPLSGESIRNGNKPMEIPDFQRGRWKDRKFTGFGIESGIDAKA